MKSISKREFTHGLKKGITIAMGYFPVSFTFGIMATSSGIPAWLAVLISVTNVTSAGQFAGVSLMAASASYYEIGLTTLLINLRYMLMSMSLSQRLQKPMSVVKRMILGFGITDEIFAIAATKPDKITAEFMYGLISGPFLGWSLGTAAGAYASGILPKTLSDAMGIALYSMFIAIIVPPARKSFKILIVIIIAVICTCVMRYIHIFSFISEGFRIIISTLIAAGAGAVLFPVTSDGLKEEI